MALPPVTGEGPSVSADEIEKEPFEFESLEELVEALIGHRASSEEPSL